MEIWKDIQGYIGEYQVSTIGRVKSFQRGGRILKNRLNNRGYYRVLLIKDGYGREFLVHSLVAKEFLNRKYNYMVVDHIDGIKTNNCINNLRWVSMSENQRNSNRCKNSSSIYNGVYYIKGKWRSQITVRKKTLFLGLFDNEIDAAKCFNDYCVNNKLNRMTNNI